MTFCAPSRLIRKACFVACPKGRPCSCRENSTFEFDEFLLKLKIMSAEATKVKCRCASKKEINGYGDGEHKQPNPVEIELEVPYDQTSIYHKMSGGTNMVLRTINKEAADMFEVGKDYSMLIKPWQEGEE